MLRAVRSEVLTPRHVDPSRARLPSHSIGSYKTVDGVTTIGGHLRVPILAIEVCGALIGNPTVAAAPRPSSSSAPKGQTTSAQGNALGMGDLKRVLALKGRNKQRPRFHPVISRPFRAKVREMTLFPGRCPGLVYSAHSGPREAREAMVLPARKNVLLIALLLATMFSGCTSMREYVHNGFKVGPNYETPEAPVAEHWIDEANTQVRTESEEHSQWWTVFNDPVLDDLIADAYRQNLDIREAGFRILQAQAQLGYARGDLFPGNTPQVPYSYPMVGLGDQVASGSFSHQLNPAGNALGSFPVTQRPFDLWSLSARSTWELDFWGRWRRAVERAGAKLDSSVEAYDAALVSMLYNVAQSYIDVRKAQGAITSLQETAKAQQQVLTETEWRERFGKATAQDTAQSRSNLAQTEALILNYEKDLRGYSNALCVLLGLPPQDLQSRLGSGPVPNAPVEVTVGIPAELLSRRPDVRVAEREAAAKAQEIGIAQADFYPAINITGTLSYQANQLPDLWNGSAFNGNVGPGFQWRILQYGKIANTVRWRDAEFRELVTTYQKTVLNAGLEVENAIKDFLWNQKIVKQREISVSSLKKALELAVEKYNRGASDYTPVSLITQDYVTQQVLLYQSRRDVADSLIRIYAALGGGWQIRLEE